MKRFLALSLLMTILLNGCAAEKAVSTPIAEPTPAPENVFTPIPSPTAEAGLAELLAAAEGQDLDVLAHDVELNRIVYTAEEGELLPGMLERYAENDAVWSSWQWNDFYEHYQWG